MSERYLIEDLPAATVRVAGEPYRLAHPDEYSLLETRDINRKWARVLALESDEADLTEEQSQEYDRLINELAGRAVPEAAADVVARWRRSWKTAVIAAFFVEAQTGGRRTADQVQGPRGPESSEASSGSTAEASTAG